jgi:hypothetical protein
MRSMSSVVPSSATCTCSSRRLTSIFSSKDGRRGVPEVRGPPLSDAVRARGARGGDPGRGPTQERPAGASGTTVSNDGRPFVC